MFTHVVFFRLIDPSKENLERAKGILEGMKGNIPQLKDMEVGADVLHLERSYDISLITRFDSLDDMQLYQVHPYHVNEVLTNLKPMLKGSASVDY